MRVRLATLNDVPAIYALGVRLIQRGSFRDTSVSYFACVNRLTDAIRNNNQWLGVAEHDGKIVGFLILVRVRYWWSDKDCYILDDGIYAERPGAGAALVRAGVKWANTQHANEIIIALNSEIEVDRSARLLNHCGLRDRGVTVSLRLREEAKQWAA